MTIKERIEEAGKKHSKEIGGGYPDELSMTGMFYEAITVIEELEGRIKNLEAMEFCESCNDRHP